MPTITETTHAGEFIVSEARGTLSREAITVLTGAAKLTAGTVLGLVAAGAATGAPVAGNTGDGTMGAVTAALGIQEGVYNVFFIEPGTNAGDFTVEGPDGVTIGAGAVGVAFAGGGIGFTISDGAADFVAGDAFTITVAAGSGKYVALDLDATNGAEKAVGILFDGVDPTAADAEGVAIVRFAEVNAEELVWPSGITAEQQTAALADLNKLGIVAR